MAYLGKHKTGGFRIIYTLTFPDGLKKTKTKYVNKAGAAARVKKNAEVLEVLTREYELTPSDLTVSLSQGLITADEASLLAGGVDLSPASWEILRKEYEASSRSAHTRYNQKSTRSRLNNLEEYFGKLPVRAIKVSTIIEWQSKRVAEKATKTVREERHVLAKMLDFAVESGALTNNPARSRILKDTLRVDKSRLPRSLTYDETRALLEGARKSAALDGRMELAALLALFAGLRRGELCFLTLDDIKGEEVVIQGKDIKKSESSSPDTRESGRWSPKSNRPRVITLPPEVAERVRTLLPEKGRFIFGGDHTHHLDTFSGVFDRVLKKINQALSLHCLRHTFVTWRIEHGLSGKGDNIVRVQQAAGHSDINTTMRYTHIKASPEKNILNLVGVPESTPENLKK